MLQISDSLRLTIWIITGVASIFVMVLSIYLESNIRYVFRQLFGTTQGGPRPRERSRVVWFVYSLSIMVSILGTAIGSSAPSNEAASENENSSLSVGGDVNAPIIQGDGNTIVINPTDVSLPTDLPNISPTALPVAMNFIGIKTYRTGVVGGLCGYSKQHSIVRGMDGSLHIFVLLSDDPTVVYESVSIDNGQTWSSPEFVSGFDVVGQIISFSCSAVTDLDGAIHLIFNLGASDTAYTRQINNDGWMDARIRGQGLPDIGTFQSNIAAGYDNSIYVIWSSKKLWYTVYDGKSWSNERDVAPGGWHPDVFIDQAGGKHVVYNGAGFIPDKSGNGESPVTVYYTYSQDGVQWLEEMPVTTSDYIWKGAATIKVDSTGRRHVTYKQWAPLEGDLYYTYSDDGEAWSLPFRLNQLSGVQTGQTGNESASMILDQYDNLYVVWKGLDGSPEARSYRLYARWLDKLTGQWSEVVDIAPVGNDVASNPSLPYWSVNWDKGTPNYILDLLWKDIDGEIVYGQVTFQPK